MGTLLQLPQATWRAQRKNALRSTQRKTIINKQDVARVTAPYINDRKKFLEGIISKITVKNTDIKTHELEIFFKFPYVGDKIIWKNENKKSDGYKIRSGRKSIKVVYDLLKK